ncbi:MAG TPA: phosphate acyltransferase, partial [Alphaproteobacteria bacterium]|nr:phosphate acyltransferase [Alphaproteobacteria bacterium]
MSDIIRISVDAMGGDKGPRVAVEGARLFWRERRNCSFLFHGRQAELDPLLAEFPDLAAVSGVVHADNVIAMDDKPSQALRKGRGNSSMWAALQSVKDGEADFAISGGNTGALMAMATFCLRPIE